MPRPQKHEANSYDKILKENIAALFIPLLSRYLGLDIAKQEVLEPKLQTTLERETDVLRLVTSNQGDQYILHLEFQTMNDPKMLFRFKEYNAIIQRKYELPIRHFLIYIGNRPFNMREQLPEALVFRGYETFDIQQLDYEEVLSSQVPEEILLTILSDMKGNDPEAVIVKVIERLQELSENKNTLRRYIAQLQVFSQLRNLDISTRKILNRMPITLDITKNAFYKDAIDAGMKKGMEQGLEKGMEQGIQQGIEKGMQKGMQKAIALQEEQQRKRIIRMSTNGISIEDIAHFEDMETEAVQRIVESA